ncbi:MAG: universal stress protein [Nocardiopsaceae bacterium]|jgi:nucleotide-binding universal stress UspA family protein|nr:universal stress protein [Nocardiopsaceae bacterium]
MSENAREKTRRIVVGVDGSPAANAALRWAVRQAELTGDTVEAVIVGQYPIIGASYGWAGVAVTEGVDLRGLAEETLSKAIAEATEPGSDVKVNSRVIEGYPASALVEESADADLLVVGSRGHGTFTEALLGSVSQHCSHHARCAVVIVRGLHR